MLLSISSFLKEHGGGVVDAAVYACDNNLKLLIDADVYINFLWVLPNGLHLIGDVYSSIYCLGAGGVIVSSDCVVESISIDGVFDAESHENGSLFLVGSPSGEISKNIRIKDLVIKNSNLIGILFFNADNVYVNSLSIKNHINHGAVFSGVTNSCFCGIFISNVGDLKRNGNRRGVGLGVFFETKYVAAWYNKRKAQVSRNITFKDVIVSYASDTAIYIHDDQGVGVSGVLFDNIKIDNVGKDGFKVRSGASNVKAMNLRMKNISLRAIVIESNNVIIDDANLENVGINGIAEHIIPAKDYSGGDAAGEAIQTHPNGVALINASNCRLSKILINGVFYNPTRPTEGNAVAVIGSSSCYVSVVAKYYQGYSVYMSNSIECSICFMEIEHKKYLMDSFSINNMCGIYFYRSESS